MKTLLLLWEGLSLSLGEGNHTRTRDLLINEALFDPLEGKIPFDGRITFQRQTHMPSGFTPSRSFVR